MADLGEVGVGDARVGRGERAEGVLDLRRRGLERERCQVEGQISGFGLERERCQVGPKDASWPMHSGGNTAMEG